ncbi:MAG: cytochrome c-type biogenesis protein CcmH [Pseudomonadales bacterium]
MAEMLLRSCMHSWRILAAALLLAAAGGLQAAAPFDLYAFDSEVEEQRFRGLIAELRCPKCLNTNLAGSDAPIAADLRRTVHRLIHEEQMSDEQILAFLQARYGDFVLYKPPFRPDTWILWFGPLLFLLFGVVVLWRMLRQPPGEPLSSDEAAEVRSILGRD